MLIMFIFNKSPNCPFYRSICRGMIIFPISMHTVISPFKLCGLVKIDSLLSCLGLMQELSISGVSGHAPSISEQRLLLFFYDFETSFYILLSQLKC